MEPQTGNTDRILWNECLCVYRVFLLRVSLVFIIIIIPSPFPALRMHQIPLLLPVVLCAVLAGASIPPPHCQTIKTNRSTTPIPEMASIIHISNVIKQTNGSKTYIINHTLPPFKRRNQRKNAVKHNPSYPIGERKRKTRKKRERERERKWKTISAINARNTRRAASIAVYENKGKGKAHHRRKLHRHRLYGLLSSTLLEQQKLRLYKKAGEKQVASSNMVQCRKTQRKRRIR